MSLRAADARLGVRVGAIVLQPGAESKHAESVSGLGFTVLDLRGDPRSPSPE